ncbi:class III lanthionine synthetase LanKC [Microbacterium album]|uniref:non-specific serine/threonine protein kinase n=1 Tax=Microbacterium album TaxID=2053191 RepID=A0A917MP11_9MICO|nr:class III lanthionine synthetase LanKC [Microbacterium album]GGH51259.1 serine/threonine protein kinase [Microbacterium album]
MDPSYAKFARAHPLFYDVPGPSRAAPLAPAEEIDWTGWVRAENEVWVSWRPADTTLPPQGWKIHVAATPETIDRLLREVSAYCGAQEIPFKHLRDREAVRMQNAKDASRGAAGKALTVYPRDDEQLHRVLLDLDARVGGTPAPYVLSDLRWKDGPLFVRYGAFIPDWTRDDDGRLIPVLRAPDGTAHEDRRDAGFMPPPWVAVPGFLQEQQRLLGDGSRPEGFAYQDIRPLHYSNAGGVYTAVDGTGNRVVLKEARPHAGLTPDGRDAVTRLHHEAAQLRALAGPGVVPVREVFELDGHHFLVLEHVEGQSLNQQMTARTPTIRADASPGDYLVYRQWALAIAGEVDAAIRRVHAAGSTHGDLHPGNVLVTPDDRVVLIDFELSRPAGDNARPEFGAAGYVAPDRRGGVDADLYALACIKLALFCPLTVLLPLDPAKLDELLSYARERFALDDAWLDELRGPLTTPPPRGSSRLAQDADAVLRAWDVTSDDGMLGIQVMIGRSLGASADFSRADRAWPGDPAQFPDNAAGLAHGAAGVLHALDACDLGVDPIGVMWLNAAIDEQLADDAPARLGLYDGLAGLAWWARQRGDDCRADALLTRIRAAEPEELGDDLYAGLPGVGLLYLSELARDARLLGPARRIARILRRRRDAAASGDKRGRAGLMWGATGTALFALRLFEVTRDAEHLHLAIDALDADLARCRTAPDGSLQLDDGRRLLPYLAEGSAGIGLVAARLLCHLPDSDRYREVVAGVTAAASTDFTMEPGLFRGRAGLIHVLVAFDRLGVASPRALDALDEHVRALRLHALRHGVGIAFPGSHLLRLSFDLATGSAGVLTALQAYSAHCEGASPVGPASDLIPLLLPDPVPSPAREPAPRTAVRR